jgi:dCMP deaminase
VIVINKDIVSSGYNNPPVNQPTCQEIGTCYREEHHIPHGTMLETCRAVGSHAESNAVARAARHGRATENATMYVVGQDFICNQCKAMIANAGIIRVVLRLSTGKIREFIPSQDWTVHPMDQLPEEGEK